MNKIFKVLSGVLIFTIMGMNCAFAEVTSEDCKSVVKITKRLKKLADRKNVKKISDYYSDEYKSFDGYTKKEMMEIFDLSFKLYPNIKTEEVITKTETKDDLIKIYISETSKAEMTVKGEDAAYATTESVKGKIFATSDYSMIFKKENDKWLVWRDEIYNETTKITYGEGIDAKFDLTVPEFINPGEEYCVKSTVDIPEERLVVGSIGHDKIIFPPEKDFDPYRTMNKTGILERIMTANKEGHNEYANMTVAFIASNPDNKKENKTQAAISGMGIYIKRVNTAENKNKNL